MSAAKQTVEAALVPDALLRIGTVEAITGLGESTIRRRMADASHPFPQPKKLNGIRCTRWVASEVTSWLRQRAEGAA